MRLAAFEPDIPQNLGGMIRLCACFGVPLDVIEPCGFPFSVRALKRAAMDYADQAEITHHDSWSDFEATRQGRLVLFTTKAQDSLWEFNFSKGDTLLMGRESAGVPDSVHNSADHRVCLPMAAGTRSLNVSMMAGIALAEALRQTDHWRTAGRLAGLD